MGYDHINPLGAMDYIGAEISKWLAFNSRYMYGIKGNG